MIGAQKFEERKCAAVRLVKRTTALYLNLVNYLFARSLKYRHSLLF